MEFLKTRIKEVVTKIIDPTWCIEARIICAPDSTVKIPKTIWRASDAKTNKIVFLI